MCNIPCVTLLACVRETSTEEVTKTNLEPEVLRLTPSDPPSQGTTAGRGAVSFSLFLCCDPRQPSPAQPSPAQPSLAASLQVSVCTHQTPASGSGHQSPASHRQHTSAGWRAAQITLHEAVGLTRLGQEAQALNRSASVSVSRRRRWAS